MKKYFVVLSVALVLGLLAGMLAFSTVSADPIPGTRIQLPVIQVDDGWETWIHIFNKGEHQLPTGVIVFFWDEYSGLCPSNSPGPSEHVCMKVPWNGVWTLQDHIPAGVKSGMVFSVDEDTFEAACDTAGDYGHLKDWVKKYYTTATKGEQLAVVVDREGLNAFDTVVSSAYTAISEEMEGDGPAYRYFAPYMMRGYHNLDTIMYIQNSGDECTSLWIQYQQQGICAFTYSQHIQQLAPGETYSTTVPAEPELPCDWLGSAYIEASQPLGIVVDQTSLPDPCDSTDRGMLLSWRGQPYQPAEGEGEPRDGVWEWDTMLYGDLVFREWSGWSSSVQVQNLTKISQPTFVVVQFFDNSGDVINTLAEWICPGGSETFYLPAIFDLGFDYWGAVEIESYKQVNWPGEVHDGAPIFAIIDLKNATTGQGGAYNAHPKFEKENAWDFALPLLARKDQGVTSLIAIRNNSNCLKINPEIKFKNQEGQIVCIIGNIWLHPKHSTLLDLAKIGCLIDGWVGAAEVIVQPTVEDFCDTDTVVMPSAVVVNRGTGLGDTTRVYEGFPVKNWCIPQQCWATLLGQVVTDEQGSPLAGAEVTVSTPLWCGMAWEETETTGATGAYTITVPGSPDAVDRYAITAAKSGYLMVDEDGITEPVTDCDGSATAGVLHMREENTVGGVVFMKVLNVNTPIVGATVELWKPGETTKWKSMVTGAQGVYSFGGLREGVTYTIKAKKDALSGTTTVTPTDWGDRYGRDIEL